MRWIFPEPLAALDAERLAAELRVPPFVASLLIRRGLGAADTAHSFLYPRLKLLGDPFALPDMERAVARIFRAISRGERIVLYGDYDVDGVTSLALFTRVLRAYGADVATFLPLRMEEGYGLSHDGIARCMETLRPQLLIALDCGTSSAAEIELLRAQGVDALVFDHHEIKATLPACAAVVNPKRGEDFHYLCSVGIVFKACHALLKRQPLPEFDLKSVLDLVAIGTVADIVPLIHENRILVQKGLEQLAITRWIGLRALMEVAAVTTPISPTDIGYRIGPRLNAAGRLGTAEAALELLLTDDPGRARTLAQGLDESNRERQAVEARTLAAAEAMLLADATTFRDSSIIIGETGWHPGVLGIVASRLMRTHHRPVLVIGFEEDGTGKGSGRSIEGFSLVQALGHCAEHLDRFGGHEMAAGITIRRERFAEFCAAFHRVAGSLLPAESLHPRLKLDGHITLGEVDETFLRALEQLQPFGTGNYQPVLCARGVAPALEPRVLKEKHLLFTFRAPGTGGRERRAIYFNGALTPLPNPPWDIAFRLERNEYNGRIEPQIQIQAIRSAE